MKSFKTATKAYLEDADYLSEDKHAPAIASLEHLAEALDEKMSGSLVTEYNKTYRYLRSLAPEDVEQGDDIDDILDDE
ncbi:hypothetical protein OHB41_33150 [Streptomyces sp. NBC_01571]|uniref:hypothetical protein n=1 Tax=Streptomyces sp. NBC_01571 TaxID=2975883 RepID=UPI00225B31BC|nr:hypothetical protein [Streptomyces sp. NBC_01571]MCX4577949.1 hypothetical protein [Streptomyces sp. NBC_01571]